MTYGGAGGALGTLNLYYVINGQPPMAMAMADLLKASRKGEVIVYLLWWKKTKCSSNGILSVPNTLYNHWKRCFQINNKTFVLFRHQNMAFVLFRLQQHGLFVLTPTWWLLFCSGIKTWLSKLTTAGKARRGCVIFTHQGHISQVSQRGLTQ